MSTDERLFGWFVKHPKALPANILTYDNGDDQTHGFYKSVSGIGVENYALNDPVLGNRVPKIVQLGLTMALLLWVNKRAMNDWYLEIEGPGDQDDEWVVMFRPPSQRVSVCGSDLTTALLDAAEAMEGSE
jgi:hypothetical protein